MRHIPKVSGELAGVIKQCQGRAESHIVDRVQTGIVDLGYPVCPITACICPTIPTIGRKVGSSTISRVVLPGGGITDGAACHVLNHQPGREEQGCINDQENQNEEKGKRQCKFKQPLSFFPLSIRVKPWWFLSDQHSLISAPNVITGSRYCSRLPGKLYSTGLHLELRSRYLRLFWQRIPIRIHREPGNCWPLHTRTCC